jgi:phosphatidylglycerophosphatase A
MPGTAGSIGAIPLCLFARAHGLGVLSLVAALVVVVGVWSASVVVRATHEEDPQIICIDEVAGMLVTFLAAPRVATVASTLVGFLLFRFFDSWKPWPARAAERLPSGWGVVMDDVAAGVWSALVLAGLRARGWL